jgi:hypothetical protein
MKVFIFGDYAFLCALYGLSGPAGTYPCLWCLVKKDQLAIPFEERDEENRTLKQMKEDFHAFCVEGQQNKKFASRYHNMIHNPLLDVKLLYVCPPYLHILLGIIKLHNDLLENDSHEIDKAIAIEMAEESKPPTADSLFATYVKKLHRLRLATQEREKLLKELEFERKDGELPRDQKKTLIKHLKKTITDISTTIANLTDEAVLDQIFGPVTSNLSVVLNENINVQAFHSHSFTGNHCTKYLQEAVYTELTNAVISKTKAITHTGEIITRAKGVARKFRKLNKLYSKVHNAVAHGRPIRETDHIDQMIRAYLNHFRSNFPDRITPKLHMLEDHVIPRIAKWGFGMALHGEQGGEGCHREFNRLGRVMHSIPDNLARLTAVMKEHIVTTHPRINKLIIRSKKRKFCDRT